MINQSLSSSESYYEVGIQSEKRQIKRTHKNCKKCKLFFQHIYADEECDNKEARKNVTFFTKICCFLLFY
jgi:hypothetical protein